MRTLLLIAASVLLAGCTVGSGTDEAAEPSPSSAPASPSPTQRTEAPAPQPSDMAQPCEDVMFQRAQGTIRAQQSALAASDYAAARGYASDGFRSTVSVEQFQQIIDANYDFLLGDPELTFSDCQRRGDFALIRVEVSAPETTIMVYNLVLENDSWFIDAATVAGVREDITT